MCVHSHTQTYAHRCTYTHVWLQTYPLMLFGCSVMSHSFATPWTVAHEAPLSMGFPKWEFWSGLPLPSPGDRPDPAIEPVSPALQTDSLPLSHLGSLIHKHPEGNPKEQTRLRPLPIDPANWSIPKERKPETPGSQDPHAGVQLHSKEWRTHGVHAKGLLGPATWHLVAKIPNQAWGWGSLHWSKHSHSGLPAVESPGRICSTGRFLSPIPDLPQPILWVGTGGSACLTIPPPPVKLMHSEAGKQPASCNTAVVSRCSKGWQHPRKDPWGLVGNTEKAASSWQPQNECIAGDISQHRGGRPQHHRCTRWKSLGVFASPNNRGLGEAQRLQKEFSWQCH